MYERKSVGQLVKEAARRFGDAPFLLFKGRSLSFREVDQLSDRMAGGLAELGVGPGDKVVQIMPNRPEIVIGWFAINKLGAVEVPLNVYHKGEVLKYMINNSDAELIIVAKPYLDRLKFIEDGLERVRQVVVFFPEGEERTVDPPIRFPTLDFDALLEHDPVQGAEVDWRQPACIIYTSGTTGLSKGVVVSHNAALTWAEDLIPYLTYGPQDTVYSVLPLFHVNAKFFTCLPLMMVGGRYAIGERFSASRFWDEVRAHGATAFHFLGGMASMIYNQPRREDDADNPVRIAWGGPVPKEIYHAFEERFGLRLNSQYFGMTETGMVIRAPFDDPHYTSCGRHTEGYEVRLLDENGDEVPPGRIGEICIRPLRPYTLMSGYYKNPQATVEAWENLWFHTGDLARRDEEGYFYFVDRKKDALRRRGENISSFEVERAILQHPAVEECAVVGVASELGGAGETEVKAVIVLRRGQRLDPEELIRFLEPRLAYFMIPRFVEFVDELPKTPTGRVEKYRLREQGVTARTWDRERAGIKLRR